MSDSSKNRNRENTQFGTAKGRELIETLRQRGLDIDFVAWLEGNVRRLPDFNAAWKLTDAELAGAIRAAAVLWGDAQEAGLSISREKWRFDVLEQFVWNLLRASMRLDRRTRDFARLSKVLKTVLPPDSRRVYEVAIEAVRKPRIPDELWRSGRQRAVRWAKHESEQTNRMRAAIACVGQVTQDPYAALATIWNSLGRDYDYDPGNLRSRLRKGHKINRTPQMAQAMLDFWKGIYQAPDWRFVSLGPFPLSPEMEQFLDQRRPGPDTGPK